MTWACCQASVYWEKVFEHWRSGLARAFDRVLQTQKSNQIVVWEGLRPKAGWALVTDDGPRNWEEPLQTLAGHVSLIRWSPQTFSLDPLPRTVGDGIVEVEVVALLVVVQSSSFLQKYVSSLAHCRSRKI